MNLTASDRKALIRLASSMEKGSEERRSILAGLEKTAAMGLERDVVDEYARFLKGVDSAKTGLKTLKYIFKKEGFTTRELDGLVKILNRVVDDRTLEDDVADLLQALKAQRP